MLAAPLSLNLRLAAIFCATIVCTGITSMLAVDDLATRGLITDILTIIVAGFAATGAFLASARCRPHARLVRMWRLIGAAFLVWGLGSVTWAICELWLKIAPYPSPADLFYLGFFPLFLTGMRSAPKVQTGRTEMLKINVEMSIAMVAGLLVFGNLLFVPFTTQNAIDPLSLILGTIYPVLDLALLWALAKLVLQRNPLRDTCAALLLAGSIFCMFVADCLFTYRQLTGLYDSGEVSAVLYITSLCLGGLAGIRMADSAHVFTGPLCTMPTETQLLGPADTRVLLWRRHIPNAIITFILLAMAWFPGMEFTPRISFLLGGSLVFVALVFIRQVLAIRENQDLNVKLRETWEGLQRRTAELQQANLQLQVAFDEQTRIEEEQTAFEGKMQQMQKLESLGVLAGGIAHDFNNLLTGILGNAGLVAEMIPKDHETQPFLQDLERAATRAAGLTNQMLAYSGKGAFTIARIDLNALASEMAMLLHASISKKVGLQMELKGRLPRIKGDPNQLTQVIMNLITNASEAIDPRSGTINVRTGMMDVD
ncbi:MAG: hypothetical protein EOP84_14290, partial [Verrucomicrobiaceae bacterium]